MPVNKGFSDLFGLSEKGRCDIKCLKNLDLDLLCCNFASDNQAVL